MSLFVQRLPNESWRDCVKRVAGEQGLERECLRAFDREIGMGANEAPAAWSALWEWDCIPIGGAPLPSEQSKR